MPRQDARLTIIKGDARDVVPTLTDRYDLLILDLFLPHGPPSWLSLSEFFHACRRCLTRTGVLSANLWANPNDEELMTLRGVSATFGGQLLLVPVSGYRNVIALGFNHAPGALALGPLRARARELSKALYMDMRVWLRIAEHTNRVENGYLKV